MKLKKTYLTTITINTKSENELKTITDYVKNHRTIDFEKIDPENEIRKARYILKICSKYDGSQLSQLKSHAFAINVAEKIIQGSTAPVYTAKLIALEIVNNEYLLEKRREHRREQRKNFSHANYVSWDNEQWEHSQQEDEDLKELLHSKEYEEWTGRKGKFKY